MRSSDRNGTKSVLTRTDETPEAPTAADRAYNILIYTGDRANIAGRRRPEENDVGRFAIINYISGERRTDDRNNNN